MKVSCPGKRWRWVVAAPVMAAALVLSSCGSFPDGMDVRREQPSPQRVPMIGRKVSGVSVRYVGAKTVDEARLRALFHVRKGGVYSEQAIEESLRDLYESGLVDDAWLEEMADGDDKVRVTVVVQTRPGMAPVVHVLGNTIFSDQKLFTRGMPCCPQGERMSRACLEEACRRIETFYRRQGYPETRVRIPRDHPWIAMDPERPDFYQSCVILVEEGEWTMAGHRFSGVRMRRGR